MGDYLWKDVALCLARSQNACTEEKRAGSALGGGPVGPPESQSKGVAAYVYSKCITVSTLII